MSWHLKSPTYWLCWKKIKAPHYWSFIDALGPFVTNIDHKRWSVSWFHWEWCSTISNISMWRNDMQDVQKIHTGGRRKVPTSVLYFIFLAIYFGVQMVKLGSDNPGTTEWPVASSVTDPWQCTGNVWSAEVVVYLNTTVSSIWNHLALNGNGEENWSILHRSWWNKYISALDGNKPLVISYQWFSARCSNSGVLAMELPQSRAKISKYPL